MTSSFAGTWTVCIAGDQLSFLKYLITIVWWVVMSGKGNCCQEEDKKYKSYPTEEAVVEFVQTPRKGHLVVQVYNGKPLQMTWSHNQPQRQKYSVDTILVTPVSKHDPSTTIPIASNDNSIKLLKSPLSSSSPGIKVDPTNIITNGPSKDL